jgi:hypothetical protein
MFDLSGPERGNLAILYCFVFFYLVFAGPAPWSIDAKAMSPASINATGRVGRTGSAARPGPAAEADRGIHRRAFLESLVARGLQGADSGHRGSGGASGYAVRLHVQEGFRQIGSATADQPFNQQKL